MNKAGERLFNGLVKENPTLVLMLGMCPTLAVTTSAINGFGMGATTLVVLSLSNLIISLLRKVIPRRVRIPAFIVIIASFVTVVELLMQAYLPALNKALGVYIPLIVVNCIILGRAESYAYSNPPIPSFFDGVGMGLGFTVALTIIGAVRELLGAGELFGFRMMPQAYQPALIFVLAPGAFFVLAALTAVQNFVREKLKRSGKSYEKIGSGCTEDCMDCADKGCARRFYDTTAQVDLKPETETKKALETEEAEKETEPAVDPESEAKEASETEEAEKETEPAAEPESEAKEAPETEEAEKKTETAVESESVTKKTEDSTGKSDPTGRKKETERKPQTGSRPQSSKNNRKKNHKSGKNNKKSGKKGGR